MTLWQEVVRYPSKRTFSGAVAMLLAGEYQHVVDDKGRVLISNKLRSQIDAEEHGSNFYLAFGANGVLCLYPEKYFERLALALAPTDAPPDEAVNFERLNFALTSKVELDSQGRLLLNDRLRKRAGLKDQVTLIGVRDHIELWNTENWEQFVSDNMHKFQNQMLQARQLVLHKQSDER